MNHMDIAEQDLDQLYTLALAHVSKSVESSLLMTKLVRTVVRDRVFKRDDKGVRVDDLEKLMVAELGWTLLPEGKKPLLHRDKLILNRLDRLLLQVKSLLDQIRIISPEERGQT